MSQKYFEIEKLINGLRKLYMPIFMKLFLINDLKGLIKLPPI